MAGISVTPGPHPDPAGSDGRERKDSDRGDLFATSARAILGSVNEQLLEPGVKQ